MELLPEEIRKQLPPLYSQDDLGDEAIAYVKYFATGTDWTWYATEFDGRDCFFGLVQGFEEELGYFTLSEFVNSQLPAGVAIERDLHFKPTPLKHLRRDRAA